MAVIPAATAGTTFDQHYRLYRTLQQNGITVVINPRTCSGGFDGMYQPLKRLLTVCQDYGKPGGPEVDWTANDYDTLRHEAQHFIQDCVLGGNHDGQLNTLFTQAELKQFINATIGVNAARGFLQSPAYAHLDDHGRMIEAEAFAVAAAIDADDIANKVNEICR